ncbi:MAG: glucose-6-phosphate dehydrogenase [Myxococcales bacterium]|nr:glucose-6-phosphate dehydrogenase [Myxococcales bacterium]
MSTLADDSPSSTSPSPSAPRGGPIASATGDPCVLVIFGASGDLTRRLLLPALYHLACDGLLSGKFAIVGMAMDDWTTEAFRQRMAAQVRQFTTRTPFDEQVWNDFVDRLHYVPGKFTDAAAFERLRTVVSGLDAKLGCGGNVLFYMATPPSVFGMVSNALHSAGFDRLGEGWKRVIVEKPFGHDLASAAALNREMLKFWREDQIYRIDHYLGKETVQNLMAFRFSNGMFEPLWNRNYVDHIQFTVDESVGVEARGSYYETSGVLRDMIQNHMFQMLAYLCMEPPVSFAADAVRNEKAKLLDAVRIMTPEQVRTNTVRGQYGPGRGTDGAPLAGYRQEPNVSPTSGTETFAAIKLNIDNWRWDGVPVYLRSGKRLWKRGTEIVVQFKRAPDVLFRNTEVDSIEHNRLIFHMQPDQGIELRFHAKVPGPALRLQNVNMHFAYGDAFKASRAIGYEVLVYNCMIGDATLFSRTDLVEGAWRIAQPLLDYWSSTPPTDFPNYEAGSWGPKAAFDMLEDDKRRWVEIINRDVMERVPLFAGSDPSFLNSLLMILEPDVFEPGDFIVREGDSADAMFFIARGAVEVIDASGERVKELGVGDFFGEIGMLSSKPRNASVRAITQTDVFLLKRTDFNKVLAQHPSFAESVERIARERYRAPEAS